jgi:hypothetical protein
MIQSGCLLILPRRKEDEALSGIYKQGTLSVTNLVVTGNKATIVVGNADSGGGVSSFGSLPSPTPPSVVIRREQTGGGIYKVDYFFAM